MSLQAIGSLLARRFSLRAHPSTVACSHHFKSLRNLTLGDVLDGAAVFTAAALAGAGGTLAVQYFMKGTHDDESADNKVITWNVRKPDMKERFEQWIVKYNKKYRDEEEKAMRFQLFKDTVEWVECIPRMSRRGCFQR